MNINLLIFTFVFSYLLIPLILAYIFISYIKTLENENCACSNDIRRKYVKYYGYYLIGISFIGILIIIFSIRNTNLVLLNNPLKILTLIINIFSTYLLYDYSNFLDENDCKCSKSWKRIFIKYYAYFFTVILSLIFFMLLITFIFHIIRSESKFIIEFQKVLIGCQ